MPQGKAGAGWLPRGWSESHSLGDNRVGFNQGPYLGSDWRGIPTTVMATGGLPNLAGIVPSNKTRTYLGKSVPSPNWKMPIWGNGLGFASNTGPLFQIRIDVR